jgi:hypothetical protein
MVYRRDIFGFREEIAELLKGDVLRRYAHQTGNISGVLVVVDADAGRASADDVEVLSDVCAASGEGTAHWRVAYIGYAFCNSL